MHILLIKTSSMGDVIHTLPALTDAFKIIPKFSCDWVVEEGFTEIPSWHGAVRKVIPIALRRWRKNLRTTCKKHEISLFLQQLRAEHYDCVIDAQGLLKSAVISFLAKGASYGLALDSVREPLASLFYKHKITISKDLHAITRIRELFAKSLNYPIPPENTIDYGIKEKIYALTETEKYLVFIHGTSREDKCWQEEKWIAMAQLAAANELEVMLPWGNDAEKERAERIAQATPNAKVLPKLSLTEIAKLLVCSKGVVTVDTGLGHLAAALDVPTIALYGPTAPALVGVRGKRARYVTDFTNVGTETVWQVFEHA